MPRRWVAQGGDLGIVGGDLVRKAVIDNGRQGAVVLDLVLEGAELLNDALALGLLVGVVGLGDGLVDVVDGAGEDDGPALANGFVGKGEGVIGDGFGYGVLALGRELLGTELVGEQTSLCVKLHDDGGLRTTINSEIKPARTKSARGV